MFDLSAFAQGLALGLGLFACPGPKDLVVLQLAVKRRPLAEILAISVGSDALLIALGMAGVSVALQAAPHAQHAALWLGAGLLLWQGGEALVRCARGPAPEARDAAGDPRGDRVALLIASFANPVAWMDTVLVIGTTGALLPIALQPSYAAGGVSASALWFVALSTSARGAARWLSRPSARRALDGVGALTLLALAGVVGCSLW